MGSTLLSQIGTSIDLNTSDYIFLDMSGLGGVLNLDGDNLPDYAFFDRDGNTSSQSTSVTYCYRCGVTYVFLGTTVTSGQTVFRPGDAD